MKKKGWRTYQASKQAHDIDWNFYQQWIWNDFGNGTVDMKYAKWTICDVFVTEMSVQYPQNLHQPFNDRSPSHLSI